MGIMRPQNKRMKSIIMAIGASIIVAIGTMFIPVSLLERFTGATGLSELVPATGAPLGDTARALIAFAAGIVTLILMLALAMRKGDSQDDMAARGEPAEDDFADAADSDFEETSEKPKSLKDWIAALRVPAMPWHKNEDDISDLADLPKLRDHDTHPDAPARRPISALTDLADADLVQPDEEVPGLDMADEQVAVPAASEEAPATEFQPGVQQEVEQETGQETWQETGQAPPSPSILASKPAPKAPLQMDAQTAPAKSDALDDLPALADMVAKLERSVEQRKAHLEQLEQVAATLSADIPAEASAEAEAVEADVEASPEVEAEIEPVATPEEAAEKPLEETSEQENDAPRPPLEAVPPSPKLASDVDDEEMDAALNAALETLQRMNTGGR